MSESFDPYHVWLGIPAESRPPTHYQLLGISPKEQERAVIEAAVLRQSGYVRNFQLGKYAKDATTLLNEIAAAKVCLLDPAKRAKYDAELNTRKAQAATSAPQAVPAPLAPVIDLDQLTATATTFPPALVAGAARRRPRRLVMLPGKRKPAFRWQIPLIIAATLLVASVGFIVLRPRGGNKQIDERSTDTGAATGAGAIERDGPSNTILAARASGPVNLKGNFVAADAPTPEAMVGEPKPAGAPPLPASASAPPHRDLPRPLAEAPAPAPALAVAPFSAVEARQHQERWAKYLGREVEATNSIGMKFVLIPPGDFVMGSTPAEIEQAFKDAGNDGWWRKSVKSEAPAHKVVLTQSFYLAVHEVTQKEYEAVMRKNPSYLAQTGSDENLRQHVADLDTANFPVEGASWNDAAEFCAKLSKQEELNSFYFRAGETVTPLKGTGYRLPTEAEWEFACRAGSTTRFWNGGKDGELMAAGWFGGNSGGRTHEVEDLLGNPFGLFDVHGNVWEWVQDAWEPTFYERFAEKGAIDPSCPFSAGSQRVIRGGGWSDGPASGCRSASRLAYDPTRRSDFIGFRVALPAVVLRASR